MSRKTIGVFIGAAVVISSAIIRLAEGSTLVEHVMDRLKNSGPTGGHIAGILMSPSLSLILGVVILGIAIDLWIGERNIQKEPNHLDTAAIDSPAKTQATVENSGNSSARGGSASIGDINFILPGAPLSRSIAEQPKKPPPAPKKYCLEMRDPVAEPIYLDDGKWRLGIGRRGDGFSKAVLLPFYFNPMKSDAGLKMYHAKAHLVFTSPQQKPPLTIAHACWLDSYVSYTDISEGETKQILLVRALPFPPSEFVSMSNNRTDYNWSDKKGDPFQSVRIDCTEYECEVLVSWGGASEFRQTFKFVLDVKQLLKC